MGITTADPLYILTGGSPSSCPLLYAYLPKDGIHHYGIGCVKHDEGRAPYCNVAEPPAWCAKEVCYVDPANCNVVSMVTSYIAGELHYSYATCETSTSSDCPWRPRDLNRNEKSRYTKDLQMLVGGI